MVRDTLLQRQRRNNGIKRARKLRNNVLQYTSHVRRIRTVAKYIARSCETATTQIAALHVNLTAENAHAGDADTVQRQIAQLAATHKKLTSYAAKLRAYTADGGESDRNELRELKQRCETLESEFVCVGESLKRLSRAYLDVQWRARHPCELQHAGLPGHIAFSPMSYGRIEATHAEVEAIARSDGDLTQMAQSVKFANINPSRLL